VRRRTRTLALAALARTALAGVALEVAAGPAQAEPAPPRTLSVVSYNVHGLPSWIARDDPPGRMAKIGPLLARYDVALVQEDWSHHEALVEAVGPRFGARGATPRDPFFASLRAFCGACGSGLTLFAAAGADAIVAQQDQPFGVCAGWLLGANDCFASKGFQRVRLRLAQGLSLDLVNVHLDAGRRDDDQAARQVQLALLADALEAASAGQALVIGGDWNLGWDVPEQRALLDAFRARLRLVDAGAHGSAGATPAGAPADRVDHVFVRSGDGVALEVTEAGEAPEFTDAGVPLSDHPAVFVRLRVEARD